jgi:hypothetical protein
MTIQFTLKAKGKLTGKAFTAEHAEIAESSLFWAFLGVLSVLGGKRVWLWEAN